MAVRSPGPGRAKRSVLEAEVRRVGGRGHAAYALRSAGDDPDADVHEAPGEDVLPVARAVHPGPDRLRCAGARARAPGQILADHPAAGPSQIARPLDPVDERGAGQGGVGEVVAPDHVPAVLAGRLGEPLAQAQLPESMLSALR